jgi:3-hydroxyisobutyrate dehydrogenase
MTSPRRSDPPALAPGAAIGFVGLGNMGAPMVGRLTGAGYTVRAFDVAEDARSAVARDTGAGVVDAVAMVAEGAQGVVLMLPNSKIVRAVLLDEGLLDALAPGTLLLDMSSSAPTDTRDIAPAIAERGVHFVDAPVSGGVKGAREGSLTIVVGGEEADVEAARPMLEVVGKRALHVGATGAGHALKALNNLLSAATLIATSEAIEAGRRFGLDPAVMIDAINTSSGRSYSTEYKFPSFVLPETFDAGFDIRLMVKDIACALELAESTGSPSEVTEVIVEQWRKAAEDLPAGSDHTAIARWIQDVAERDPAG